MPPSPHSRHGPPRQPQIDEDLRESIAKGLNEVFDDDSTPRVPFDPEREKIVVFSDLHKGSGDDADDFRNCEHAFTMALGWYLEHGWKLFLLGDVEELWEENPEPVLARYRDVLGREAEFRRRGGLERFWGNHDDLWASKRNVKKHLQRPDVLGPGLVVHEGMRLEVARRGGAGGTLFFVHGHQGTTASDRLGALSRLPVRHVWRRVQRATGWSATTPARDFALRAQHDLAMALWAAKRGVVLITGHTHRPVFAQSQPPPPPTRDEATLERALAEAAGRGDVAAAASARAELEYARTANRRPARVLTVDPPCYFNTGCCSFPDGDITGLELAEGQIRLVRWPGLVGEMRPEGAFDPEQRLLEEGSSRPLADVLAAVASAAGRPPVVLEHAVSPG